MSDIKQRANFTIARDLSVEGAIFLHRFDLNFIPDVMKVNYAQYRQGGESGLYYVYTNLVNKIIFSFQDTLDITEETAFDIKEAIKGDYFFRITDSIDELDPDNVGDLVFHLEFIKYK